jgi:hypothetical protein
MNIFVIDHNPTQSAQWLCDAHCNKMVLESAQMLANCFSPEVLADAPKTKKGTVRRYSYFNHPCSIWVRESHANFDWLCRHSIAMEHERLERGFNPHFSYEFIKWAYDNRFLAMPELMRYEQTEFAVAIADDKNCKKVVDNFDELDRIAQYRLYYKYDKPFATWKRNRPHWMDCTDEEIIKL